MTHLYYTIKTMVADGLPTQETSASVGLLQLPVEKKNKKIK